MSPPVQQSHDTRRPDRDALYLHPFYHGKIQVMPKCPVRDLSDFAVWYTPGVAAPCRDIQEHPEQVFEHTNKGNTVAIVTDGTRVLGLGDIGPEAALPVMEGKALLFKYLGDVDAVPICLDTKEPDTFIQAIKLLEPAFGGINLEDIAQPKCFQILDTLRAQMDIPVWHDDQQGTATVVMAALINALKVVEKEIGDIRIAMIGVGAANVANYRMITNAGVDPGKVIACDLGGILHPGRHDIEERQDEFTDAWKICLESNRMHIRGGIAEAMRGADVCIAFSCPDPELIHPEWVSEMADDAVVFACANPTPEIWPWVAEEAGAAIVATGRGDFPNQLNNSLCFPAIFRGVLDVRARHITDGMQMAAASELARFAEQQGLHEKRILPRMDEWEVFPRVAVATAMQALAEGVARRTRTKVELDATAHRKIREARESLAALVDAGVIAPAPREAILEMA
jgi:malate dehydrogenase (oxaloacetate-decarboxylating)